MKKLVLTFLIAISLISCSETIQEHNSSLNSSDNTEDATVEHTDIIEGDTTEWVPWVEEDASRPPEECIECKWYFCPPLDAVWQKEICLNMCDDPPTLHSEGVCEEYMECDPTQYHIDFLECTTEEGYAGVSEKVCNKGKIQYTDCITDCVEETCDYIDNDCDESIDEGVLNACGTCEEIPEETCNELDDDCDGFTDEGQLNDCNECGTIPSEECNAFDDDCDGLTDEELFQPCATACGNGVEICESGNWISCTAPPELDEVCDGLDNNCNGQIDEGLECICTMQDVGSLFPCQEAPLLCGQGYKTCECLDPECKTIVTTPCYAICYYFPPNPQTVCDQLIGMELEKEECNNFDDNCNQLIDEDLFSGCYTGPEGTLFTGECMPGEMYCDKGTWGNDSEEGAFIPYYCKEEITPQEELCNGLDDDCDGLTDWGEEIPDTDILFIVDWSGSMADEIDAVMIALNQFAANFSDEEVINWALIRGPLDVFETAGPQDERLELHQNLVGFTEFLASMTQLGTNWAAMQTSYEMILDAVYLSLHNISAAINYNISDMIWKGESAQLSAYPWGVKESIPPLQDFKVNWRAGADRIIIVFSDEPPQSYLVPHLAEQDVITAINGTPQLKLYTFSKSIIQSWTDLSDAGNGKNYMLTSNPTEMYNNLMEIFNEICKGGN